MARILFDLDGTLIDSAADIQAGVALMLTEEGREALDLPTIISFIGNGLPHLVKLVIGATGLDMADHARLTERTLHHYETVSGTATTIYPGVVSALNDLTAAGHVLGICTNKPETAAHAILEKLGFTQFQSLIGGDTLPQRKPDPAPLFAAAEPLGDGPIIFVGDTEVDAETARATDVPLMLFTNGYRKTDVSQFCHTRAFDHFDQLPGLINEVLST